MQKEQKKEKKKENLSNRNSIYNRKQTDHLSAKDVGEMGFHREFHDLDIPVCSAGDCTGLIPTPPQSDAEQESYEELYPYLPKAINKK